MILKTGIIYIIKNKCNDKVYIGQTTSNLQTRFNQHFKKSTIANRHYKLYNAIKKYGKDNFYIELLEERIPIELLNEREIFYIEKYNSFYNGYNSSKGGDGRTINKTYDEEVIVFDYLRGKSLSEICKKYNISNATISRCLKRLKIKTRHDGNKYESIDKNTFLELWYKKSVSIEDMANKFGVDPKTIRRHAKRLNLNRKGFDIKMLSQEGKLVIWKKLDNQYEVKETVFQKIDNLNEIKKLVGKNKIMILIGENPSKGGGVVCDETNMYLRNKLFEEEYDGYFLLNFISLIQTKLCISRNKLDFDYIRKQTELLKVFKELQVCVFYGTHIVYVLNKYKFSAEEKNILDEYYLEIKKHKPIFTTVNGMFTHPSKPGSKDKFVMSELHDDNMWIIKGL